VQEVLKGYTFPVALHLIEAENHTLHKLYGAQTPCLCLIRPDGYIAYKGAATDLQPFSTYLDRVFTKQQIHEQVPLPEK
jgi:hypothetical protein